MQASLQSLTVNVASSATPQALSPTTLRANFIRIKAKTTNTNPVYIGGSNSQDYVLTAGQELPLDYVSPRNGVPGSMDLSTIFCKCTTNGEGVVVIYSTAI